MKNTNQGHSKSMHSLHLVKVFPILFFVTILTSCATAPQQKLNLTAKQGIQTVALLTVPNPEVYTALNIGSMKGFLLGPIGGYLEAQDNAASSKKLTRRMQELNHTMGDMLLEAINKGLTEKNYTVVVLDQRPGTKENGEADYSNIQTDADVILDVWFRGAGYISPQNSIGYEPHLLVSSRMVSAQDKSQLYFQAFNYAAKIGYVDKIISYDQIGTNEYSSLDMVIENAPEVVKELMLGIPLIANGIINEL